MHKRSLLFATAMLALLLGGCDDGEPTPSSPGATSNPTSQTSSNPPVDYAQRFSHAKEQTVDSDQYEYTFELKAKIKFAGAINFSPATYSGKTQINENASGTNFYQERNVSGLLVIDNTTHIYNEGNDLVKISEDEDKDFSVINHESVESWRDLDTHNFGRILKTLDANGLLKAELKNNKYQLSLKPNFSKDSILGILNYIDSNIILKALSSLTESQWGVGLSVNTWATLTSDNAHLQTFHFDATISIKDYFDVGFELDQTFTKYSGVNIVVPTFTNVVTGETEINTVLNNVKSIYDTTVNAPTSYYDYNVKTTVDHGISKSNPFGFAVDSTTKGYAKRQIVGDTVYFNNRLEVDSDYKNKDQLGDLVKDYDSYRAKINDGDDTVYDVEDPKIGFKKYTALAGYDEETVDNFYMLPKKNNFEYGKIIALRQSKDSDEHDVYKFGLSTNSIKSFLQEFNSYFRIDFKRETIFDIYKVDSDFSAKKGLFTLTVDEGKILSLNLDLKGFYTETGSQDEVKYRFQVKIDFDWSKSYTAVTDKSNISK